MQRPTPLFLASLLLTFTLASCGAPSVGFLGLFFNFREVRKEYKSEGGTIENEFIRMEAEIGATPSRKVSYEFPKTLEIEIGEPHTLWLTGFIRNSEIRNLRLNRLSLETESGMTDLKEKIEFSIYAGTETASWGKGSKARTESFIKSGLANLEDELDGRRGTVTGFSIRCENLPASYERDESLKICYEIAFDAPDGKESLVRDEVQFSRKESKIDHKTQTNWKQEPKDYKD